MQTEGYTQSGGFDPGLSALIGALLTGGIGAYGYSKESRSTEDLAAARLEGVYKERLLDAEKTKAQASTTLAQVSAANLKVTNLERERDELKRSLATLKGKVESAAGPALAFQSASAQTLKDAIPFVIDALKSKYIQLVTTPADEAKIRKVLEYPTTYQAKLAQLTLPAFYAKQVSIVLQQIADKPKGGRRRYRRRGGAPSPFATDPADAAIQEAAVRAAPPVSTNAIPSYDEFATIYEEAIRKATSSEFSREEKRQSAFKEGVDKKVQEKKNAAAVAQQKKKDDAAAKVAQTIIPKFEKAIQEGEKAVKDNESLVKILSTERQASIGKKKGDLEATIEAAKALSGVSAIPTPVKKRFGLFGGAATLREVKTEADWNEKKQQATDLLQKVKDATKAFVDEVKAMSKAEKKSFDVPKVEFGLPKIPVPSLNNPFAPIAKRLGEAKDAADQAAIVRKETRNAVLFMKDILKKVDTALKEVVLSEKATARRNRKKGGAVDPDAFEPRREMDGYDSLGIQALAANLKAVAKGGTETVGGKTFNWLDKKGEDITLHPLSFYLAQLNTSIFSGTVDLFIAATSGKPREFSRDVFVAAGEQYVLVRTYMEDVVEGLKNPALTRATRLERLAIGVEESVSAVAEVATSVVGGIMALAKKVSPALVGTIPGAPVPLAITADMRAKINELIAKYGTKKVKLVLGRLKAKISSLLVEKQAGMTAVVAAGEKVIEEAEAREDEGIEMTDMSPKETVELEEATDAAIDETPPVAPFEIEPGQGPVPPGEFLNVSAPATPTSDPAPAPFEIEPGQGPVPPGEFPNVMSQGEVSPVTEGSNPTTPTSAPPSPKPVKPERAPGESEASWRERNNAYKASLVLARTRLRVTGKDLTRGGRRRKSRKSTLKKRRGGK